MPAWFYIMRLKSVILYPGATTNLEQRWRDHHSGQACRTTMLDSPAALVFHEQFATFSEARRREAQVKRWSAKKKEALVSGDLAVLKSLAVSRDSGASSPISPSCRSAEVREVSRTPPPVCR